MISEKQFTKEIIKQAYLKQLCYLILTLACSGFTLMFLDKPKRIPPPGDLPLTPPSGDLDGAPDGPAKYQKINSNIPFTHSKIILIAIQKMHPFTWNIHCSKRQRVSHMFFIHSIMF